MDVGYLVLDTQEASITRTRRLRLIAATSIAPLLWGTTYLTTTELLPPDRPLLAAVIRALPAGLLMIAITRTLPRGRWWWRSLVLGTLNFGAFFSLLFVSAYRLPGGVSATLGATHPLIVALLAVLILREPNRIRTWVAAVLGLAGVGMLVLTPGASYDAVGVTAGLISGIALAFGAVLTKKWGLPVGLVPFTGWQLAWGGLVLVVPMLVIEGVPSSLSLTNVTGYLWLMTAGAVISYLLWFRGLLALPASQVSLLSFLAPLTAAVLGWAVLSEALTLLQGLGGLVIVASVILGQSRTRTRATPGAPGLTPLGSDHGHSDPDHHRARRAPAPSP